MYFYREIEIQTSPVAGEREARLGHMVNLCELLTSTVSRNERKLLTRSDQKVQGWLSLLHLGIRCRKAFGVLAEPK